MKSLKFNIISIVLLLTAASGQAQSTSPSPWSYRVFVSPAITNLASDQYKSEETSGFGFNAGGDLIYNFFRQGRFSMNASVGLGITNYNSSRLSNYTNKLSTSEYEQVLAGSQNLDLTETANNLKENQHFTFLDIPVKLGFDYQISSKWAAYANLGMTYGVNLSATYNSTALLTRTGFYPDYNVLIYDVDVPGSPYYYPTNKAVSGSGSISRRNNFSAEGALGAKYMLNSHVSLFAGAKLMHGFENVKNSPSTMILATSDNSLNTLASRTDNVKTRAFGLEVGAQFSLNFCKHKVTPVVKPVESVIEYAQFTGKVTPAKATILISNNGNIIKTIEPDANGQFNVDLQKEKVYDVEVTAPDYVSQKTSLDLNTLETKVIKDFSLEPVKVIIKEPEIKGVELNCKVVEAGTLASVKASMVVRNNGEVVETIDTDKNGIVKVDIPEGKVYDLEVTASGYVPQRIKADLTNVQKGDRKEITLDPFVKIEKETVFKFKSINFQLGTDKITHKSFKTLNMVAQTLVENSKLRIEVSGYTDNVGNPTANLTLSQKRATTVMNYIINKGANAAQVKAIGCGEIKPIADNRTREGKAKNRRVEFKVVDM